jgi:hypothetical protein
MVSNDATIFGRAATELGAAVSAGLRGAPEPEAVR